MCGTGRVLMIAPPHTYGVGMSGNFELFPLCPLPAPPIAFPCPDKNLVVECTTRSAPCSNGRQRYGVAMVLSITNGTFTECAASANAVISVTTPPGFANDSAHTSFTFFSLITAVRTAWMSSVSTKTQRQPNLWIVFPNCVIEPP